ncbi:MAG TPA: DUF1244 domain-containing protein [Thermomonas sp.]|nr:DUF1244 domain-containing protein [Thermomonas sp.]HQW59511.1 DUF1244 domain-containing protein [Thermomonas sp.]
MDLGLQAIQQVVGDALAIENRCGHAWRCGWVGRALSPIAPRDGAREAVYGMPIAGPRARQQAEATPEPMAAPGACQRWTGTSAFIVLDKSWQGATWQSRANVRNAASGSCT